jgi:Leucine-rich repeat (LRR) protein/flagellar motor component MotA
MYIYVKKRQNMECYIVKNGVEVKAGLEDILPLLDDRLINHFLSNAYKIINLSYVLAYMPDEIKNMVYRNLSIRIHGKIKEEVKDIEAAYKKDSGYFERERAKLISFIGENINLIYGSPNRLVWKENKPKVKTQADLIDDLIKRIEKACASKTLHLPSYETYKMSKEDVQNAFTAFHDRKNELQKIQNLRISMRDLPAAAPLFENGGLDTLTIDGEFTGTWPEFLENCGNLTLLALEANKSFTEFPSWIHKAVSLRKLFISWSSGITYLPDWIGDLQSLTEINIDNKKFKTLPDGIGNLKNLAKLNIRWSDMEKLPDSIGNLCSLKELILDGIQKLTTLPDSIGNLTNLAKLTIHCSAIEKLPESFGNLCSLKELTLTNNKKLTSLPDSIGSLKNLTKFVLNNSAVKTLPFSIGHLQNLIELSIDDSKIEKLPDSIGNLQNLTEFSLTGSKIEKLPGSIGNLEKLTNLYLGYNKELKRLPNSIGNLKKLVTLNLRGAGLVILPNTLANCTSLERVDVCDTGFTSLPNFISSVKVLRQTRKLLPEKRGISYISFCNYYYTIVEMIFRFTEKAQREGLLALEDELDDLSDDFFKTGIRLVVDGTDGAVIQDLLTLKIEREHDYYIKKLMETAMEGILGIQAGERLCQIGIRLASMVDIKNNALETACAIYLSGDFNAFENIDFMSAFQPEEEREELTFIKRAIEISELARREGWMEVEKHLDNEGIAAMDVFEYGLPMAVDNWDYKDIEKELSLLIARETDPVRKNLALAKKDAIIMICAGYNTRILLLMLAAYFDDDFTKEWLPELLKE